MRFRVLRQTEPADLREECCRCFLRIKTDRMKAWSQVAFQTTASYMLREMGLL